MDVITGDWPHLGPARTAQTVYHREQAGSGSATASRNLRGRGVSPFSIRFTIPHGVRPGAVKWHDVKDFGRGLAALGCKLLRHAHPRRRSL